jgi:hypothetical protein
MVCGNSDSKARAQWWFEHLYPDTELDCSTSEHLVEVVETEWWLEALALARVLDDESCPPPSGRRVDVIGGIKPRGQLIGDRVGCSALRRPVSRTIGWPTDSAPPHPELRDDLIMSMRATFHHLHPDEQLDDRTATVLVSIVERSLWLEATKDVCRADAAMTTRAEPA